MILSGHTIRKEIGIEPFSERTVHEDTGTTYGVSYAGYDVRTREPIDLAPGQYIIGSIIEHIMMPLDVIGVVHDKSSLARLGLALQNTVIEPGWRGYLTTEISNHSPHRIQLPAGAPIAQIMFHRIDIPTPGYSGKYQDQPPAPVSAVRENVE